MHKGGGRKQEEPHIDKRRTCTVQKLDTDTITQAQNPFYPQEH